MDVVVSNNEKNAPAKSWPSLHRSFSASPAWTSSFIVSYVASLFFHKTKSVFWEKRKHFWEWLFFWEKSTIFLCHTTGRTSRKTKQFQSSDFGEFLSIPGQFLGSCHRGCLAKACLESVDLLGREDEMDGEIIVVNLTSKIFNLWWYDNDRNFFGIVVTMLSYCSL